MILAAAGPSPLWYLSRGTGAITLVLLSATVRPRHHRHAALAPGSADARASSSTACTATSRCSSSCCSRRTSLTALLDPFAHCASLDAVVPLASRYRPLWLGLGALALDLLIAARRHERCCARASGLRAWRAVHWAAYACWPVARAARPGDRDRRALDVAAGADRGVRRAASSSRWPRGSCATGRRGRACASAALAASSPPRSRRRRLRGAGPAAARLGAPGGHARRPARRRRARRWPHGRRASARHARAPVRGVARRHLAAGRPPPADGGAQIDIAARIHVARRAAASRPAALSAGRFPAAACRCPRAASALRPSGSRTLLPRPRGGAERQPRRGPPRARPARARSCCAWRSGSTRAARWSGPPTRRSCLG